MIRLVDAVVRGIARTPVHVPVRLPPGVEVRRSRVIPWLGGILSGMGRSAGAVALGRTIVVHPGTRADERLLRHELAHVAQWLHAPFVFPFRYIRAHIRHGYRENPYEVEARSAERDTHDTRRDPWHPDRWSP